MSTLHAWTGKRLAGKMNVYGTQHAVITGFALRFCQLVEDISGRRIDVRDARAPSPEPRANPGEMCVLIIDLDNQFQIK